MSNNNGLQVIAETKTLAHALSLACSVVEKRNVTTELSHIKLLAKNNMLELLATDMDLYLSQKISAQILQEGEVTLSIWTLADIVKKFSDKEIKIISSAIGSNQLEIIGRNCNFKLLTGEPTLFPVMEDIKLDARFTISCAEFAKIIDATKFSVSTDETRYNLNGIYLHIKDGKAYAASTDGHRLSVSSVACDKKIDDFGVIVPKKTAYETLKILRDTKNIASEVEILLSYNKIKFVFGKDMILLSKLIDGTFPDYGSFIPERSDCKLTINSKILMDAISRVSIVTIDKFRAVKFTFSSNGLEITASGEAKGEAKEVIAFANEESIYCEFSGDHGLKIGFNPQYLMDVFEAMKHDKVELHFTNFSAPVLISFPKDESTFFVVMPVNV